MSQPLDLLTDAEWSNHAAEALERNADHCLTLEEWAAFLLKQNPNVYTERRASDLPSADIPGTRDRLATMGLRVKFGANPFGPDDLCFAEISDEECRIPEFAGNFHVINTREQLERHRHLADETLAERSLRWLAEDRAIRERWQRTRSTRRRSA